MTAAPSGVDGGYGFVLAARDPRHGLSFWNVDYGFGPLFNATVFSKHDAARVDAPIGGEHAEWLALPGPLVLEPGR